MSARKVIAASATAFAVAVMSVPVVNAQDATGAGGSGLLPLEGLLGGSVESSGSDTGSLDGLVPESGEICELPSLGGSVAKFYPLFGIEGVPVGVLDIVTTALDSFPNLLELVAGEGAGASLLAETGSLDEGLCTAVFGGEMVMPPETVYVDEDGNPVSTVTATVEPWGGSSGSGSAGSGGTAALPTTVPVSGR